MSLINDALKRARVEALRQEAAKDDDAPASRPGRRDRDSACRHDVAQYVILHRVPEPD